LLLLLLFLLALRFVSLLFVGDLFIQLLFFFNAGLCLLFELNLFFFNLYMVIVP
jgi:hypothetical protein